MMKMRKTVVTTTLAVVTAVGIVLSMFPSVAEARGEEWDGVHQCSSAYVIASARAGTYAYAEAGLVSDEDGGNQGPYTARANSYRSVSSWEVEGQPFLLPWNYPMVGCGWS